MQGWSDLLYGFPMQHSRIDPASHTQTYPQADRDTATDGSIAESDFIAVKEAYDAKANGPQRPNEHAFLRYLLGQCCLCPRESLSNGK
mmetsp:Transcript_4600/g.8965  ORF Transcript_4600/g.8965 Transcript_4600/m.8965 type:complete len:88 (+) Transcript_4600:36-299(+)